MVIVSDGMMKELYVVLSVKDLNIGEEIDIKIKIVGKLISVEIVKKMCDELKNVISGEYGIGKLYVILGYDVVGKIGIL